MRAVGSWMLGIGGVQAGCALVRLLVALLPAPVAHRDPPLWSAGVLLVSAAIHVVLGRRLLAERGGVGARAAVGVAISGWLLLTLVSLNTASVDPGSLENGSVGSLSAVWRGAGWPGMLTIADGFTWRPSGQWRAVDVVLAGLSLALGLALLSVSFAPSVGEAATAKEHARGRVTSGSRPARTLRTGLGAGRLLGLAVALHLAILVFLTIAVLVGLSFRVAGLPFI